MFVTISNDPLRGIRPSWMTPTESYSLVQSSPLPIGSLVWYMDTTDRFTWYIPAIVQSYIVLENDKEVIQYKLRIDHEEDEGHRVNKEEDSLYAVQEDWMTEMAQTAQKVVEKAIPQNVIERWDENEVSCPIPGLDNDTLNRPPIISPPPSKLLHNVEGNDKKHDAVQIDLELVQAQNIHGSNLGFEGTQQNGYGPEHWGITLEQLQQIVHDPAFVPSTTSMYGGDRTGGGMTMYEVVQHILKPKTHGTGMGYSLLLNQDKPLRAKVMVSHAWGEDYERFLATLESSTSQGPFWVCAMAIYQNEDLPHLTIAKQLGPSPATGPFSTVLKQCSHMVAIVTPDCDIYTRLWCVYEMFVAIQLGVFVELAFFSESTGWGGSGQTYFNAGMDNADKPVNTQQASCSSPSDQQMIADQVRNMDGGFDLLNDVVYWIKSKALIDVYKKGFVRGMETTARKPFGVSSASCVHARLNVAIYKILEQWKQNKRSGHQQQDPTNDTFEDNDDFIEPFMNHSTSYCCCCRRRSSGSSPIHHNK